MTHKKQLAAWEKTQHTLIQLVDENPDDKWLQEFESVALLAEINNLWFTKKQLLLAIKGIIVMLEPESMKQWSDLYPEQASKSLNIGVIMAGNVPLAGFHDVVCVIFSGHNIYAKLSNSDKFLLPFIAKIFFSHIPELQNRFHIADQLKNMDAVIATGSNNTSRYFEYYFGKKPHIFRKNRNSAAIITGEENEFDFILLGQDIFTYYGLG